MKKLLGTAPLILLTVWAGCRDAPEHVQIDGSSTVYPITSAAAEMFLQEHPRVRVTVGISGTGGGFQKFLDANPRLRTDINDASRPIRPTERELAAQRGIEFIELPIALDGLSVVVNPRNDFCDYLTVDELRRMWEPGSTIRNWKDVREGFPDLRLKLYGPGSDSGTFDYFTEAIVGREKASRSDYTASEDDNTLVQGVAGDVEALGYFGYAYYEANAGRLKLVAINGGDGPVKPSLETVRNGTYQPLSRPVFLYVNRTSLERPAVESFLDFYLEHAREIAEHPKVGYVALSDDLYAAVRKRVDDRVTGTAFTEAPSGGPVDLVTLYGRR